KAQAHALDVVGEEVLGELPRERHQVVVRDRSGDDDLHRMYFRRMGSSSFFVCSGQSGGCVMMAGASAALHPHASGAGIRSTAAAIVFCAVAAFCIRFAIMRSTVTES